MIFQTIIFRFHVNLPGCNLWSIDVGCSWFIIMPICMSLVLFGCIWCFWISQGRVELQIAIVFFLRRCVETQVWASAMAHQRHVVQQLHERLRFLSVDSLDCSNSSCCMKSSVQHPMLHWSNVSNAFKCVKCENSSLEIAQQIAAAWPFRHDIPEISKSEVLGPKLKNGDWKTWKSFSRMAGHGTYGIINWLVVEPTPLKNISHNGNLLQI